MKLHPDGTVEGTPQEIAEYRRMGAEAKAQRLLKQWELDRILRKASADVAKEIEARTLGGSGTISVDPSRYWTQ